MEEYYGLGVAGKEFRRLIRVELAKQGRRKILLMPGKIWKTCS
jgi:hypothetical protein